MCKSNDVAHWLSIFESLTREGWLGGGDIMEAADKAKDPEKFLIEVEDFIHSKVEFDPLNVSTILHRRAKLGVNFPPSVVQYLTECLQKSNERLTPKSCANMVYGLRKMWYPYSEGLPEFMDLITAVSKKVYWAANKRFEVSKFQFKFPRARTFELYRARSWLYRSQIL